MSRQPALARPQVMPGMQRTGGGKTPPLPTPLSGPDKVLGKSFLPGPASGGLQCPHTSPPAVQPGATGGPQTAVGTAGRRGGEGGEWRREELPRRPPCRGAGSWGRQGPQVLTGPSRLARLCSAYSWRSAKLAAADGQFHSSLQHICPRRRCPPGPGLCPLWPSRAPPGLQSRAGPVQGGGPDHSKGVRSRRGTSVQVPVPREVPPLTRTGLQAWDTGAREAAGTGRGRNPGSGSAW